MSKKNFDDSELNHIAETALYERLAEPACRSLLLGHIDPRLRSMLEHSDRPDLQVRLDLMYLNRWADTHADNEPALAIWLDTAARLSASSTARNKFQQWGEMCRRQGAAPIEDIVTFTSSGSRFLSQSTRIVVVGTIILTGLTAAALLLSRDSKLAGHDPQRRSEVSAGQATSTIPDHIFALDVPGGRPVRVRTLADGIILLGELSSHHAAPRGLLRLNLPSGTILNICDAYPIDSSDSLTSCFEAALAATENPFAVVRLQIVRPGNVIAENLDLEVARP